MDMTVLHRLTYGMYAIGTLDGSRATGCIVNTVVQITSGDPVIAVSMNKDNFTFKAMKECGRFSVSILSEKTSPNVIAALGFTSGRDKDKFSGDLFAAGTLDGLPVVKDNICGHMTADIVAMQEMDTHYVILGRVTNATAGVDYAPMTYKYYHEVIKGKAPKNAPTYQAEAASAGKYVCGICGYVYEGDITKEPEDFVCPVCFQGKQYFKKQ